MDLTKKGLSPSKNLSDLKNAAIARANLGLGSAAEANTGDFATAIQGGLADTAVQPADLPTFGDIVTHDASEFAPALTADQNYVSDAELSKLTGIDPLASVKSKLDATTAPTVNDDSGDGYGVGSLWIDVTGDRTYRCVDASVGAAVWIETLKPASAAETTTGTETAKAVTPDGLAGSSIFGVKALEAVVFDFATDVATGDGKFYFVIPPALNGMNLVGCHARVITAGTTGTMDIQLRNVTDSVDMLSEKIHIDSGEVGSDTAATPYVIDTTKDDVASYDVIAVDIDAVSSTKQKGTIISLWFQLA